MKPLRTFLMEDHLESHRFSARYNFGESGARPRTVRELVEGARLDPDAAARAFLGLSLRDSPNWGRRDLREAIAAFHPGASADDVLVTTGTSEALLLLFRRLAPRKVALALPAFQLLYEIPLALGAEIVGLPVEFDASGAPFVDVDSWRAVLARERPDVVILNNPHNPSGLVFSDEAVACVREHVDAAGAWLVCDEHYRFLSSDDAILGPTGFRPDARTFVTGSFTKCLGAPGLRIGWCVGSRAVLTDMQGEKNYTTHTVNPVSEWLATALLEDVGAPAFASSRSEWKSNRARLADVLGRSPILLARSPRGGLVTALGFRGVSTREAFDRVQGRLLAEGIFCLPLESMEFGTAFGGKAGPGLASGHGVRLGLGLAPDLFAAGLSLLERVVSETAVPFR